MVTQTLKLLSVNITFKTITFIEEARVKRILPCKTIGFTVEVT